MNTSLPLTCGVEGQHENACAAAPYFSAGEFTVFERCQVKVQQVTYGEQPQPKGVMRDSNSVHFL